MMSDAHRKPVGRQLATPILLAFLLANAPVAESGLVAHWTFDEGTGTNAADEIDSPANDGFLEFGADWNLDSPAVGNAAIEFDGFGGIVTTVFEGVTGDTARSVTMWIRAIDPQNEAPGMTMLSYGGSNGNGSRYSVRLNNNGGNGVLGAVRLEVAGGYIIGTTPLLDGEWHHIAVVNEASTDVNQATLYVDGELEEITGSLDEPIFSGGTQTVAIGGSTHNGAYNFTGGIDDVRVFDHALTDEEVRAIFTGSGIIQSFAATPEFVGAGESATLSWTVGDFSSLTIDQGVGDVGPLTVGGAGSVMIMPAQTTTYTLTAVNDDDMEERQVTVVVNAPPAIDRFEVAPTTEVVAGEPVQLSWSVTNADSITIEPGIGAVDAEGVMEVPVSVETVFTLTATNANGNTMAQVTALVRPPNGIPELLAFWPLDGDVNEICGGHPTILVDDGGAAAFEDEVPPALAARRTRSIHFGPGNFSDYIRSEFQGIDGFQPRTVTCWAKVSEFATSRTIFWAYGSALAGEAGRANSATLNGGSLSLYFHNGAGNVTAPGFTRGETWVHVAFVFSGLDATIPPNATLYFDGVPVATGTGSGTVDTALSDFLIGRDETLENDPERYADDTWLSEVAFWSGELTPTQIRELAAGLDPQTIGKSPRQPFAITAIEYDEPLGTATLTWNSTPGAFYSIDASSFLSEGSWAEVDDSIAADGFSTTRTVPAGGIRQFFRVRRVQ